MTITYIPGPLPEDHTVCPLDGADLCEKCSYCHSCGNRPGWAAERDYDQMPCGWHLCS